MRPLFELPLILSIVAQTPAAEDADFAAAGPARLDYMKKSVVAYDIRTAADPNHPLMLQAEPVLRFTNPVGRSRDGTVFLWLDAKGRPGVVAQASLNRRGSWIHEFSSLSPGALTAASSQGVVWNPITGGVEFRPVPNAPAPAPTAERRFIQMRALTRDFAVEDNFERKAWQALRLLPKPFARYGKAGSGVLDGVLFTFVLTTDPEAYLMLEAREDRQGAAWHYAWAPSTMYPLRASLKGKTVWERNIDGPEGGAFLPLCQVEYSQDQVSAKPKAP